MEPLAERPRCPMRTEQMAPAKPFLMPSIDNTLVEVLPSEKSNRKLQFTDQVTIFEIEHRYDCADYVEEDEDEGSYEIEIVEDDGDADFYLEIVDGEVYYVFETEDDISVDSDESDEEAENDSPHAPAQLDIANMQSMLQAPNLDADDVEEQLNTSMIEIDSTASLDTDDHEEPLDDMETDKPIEVVDEPSESEEPLAEPVVVNEVTETPVVSPVASPPNSPVSSPKLVSPVSPAAKGTVSSPTRSPSSPSSPVKSILKACPESPRRPVSPKSPKKRDKNGNKQKTFSKTYVRADYFDGEHRVYSWEKPKWTETKLKSTGKDIRSGENLASPITFPNKKPANDGLDEDNAYEEVNKEELLRRLKGAPTAVGLVPLPRYRKNQSKLKFSIHGARIRDGGDIVKPITKATVLRKPDDINHLANPTILKNTPLGEKVRTGRNLAAPVTKPLIKFDDTNHVANKGVLKNRGVTAEKKKYEWSKPSWVKPKLNSTGHGDLVKSGGNMSAPITHINDPAREKGRDVDRDCDLSSTSTHSVGSSKTYEWAKPEWTKRPQVKPSKSGELARQGENLARPITELPDLAKEQSNQ